MELFMKAGKAIRTLQLKSPSEKGGFRQQCQIWFLQRRMLVIHSPTIHKFTDALFAPRRLLPPYPNPPLRKGGKTSFCRVMLLVKNYTGTAPKIGD
jgi:hypothetical protein